MTYPGKLGVLAIGLLVMAGGQWAWAQSSDDAHEHDHTHDHAHEHRHEHVHDEDIYAGHFDDEQIEDRSLADWQGEWQSVYPYLQDGTLDPVMAAKAVDSADKTADDVKAYYQKGYRTDVARIEIDGSDVTLHDPQGARTGEYAYDGYEVLTYEAGNRGVRYIFERQAGGEALPAFIQFSDHAIAPRDAHHYHLYWGDDRQALLEEVEHWPTYYPADMDGEAIAEEMLAH
ncbi:metal-binding protein ZinT [Halomonas sp. ND22Bw]|uniref:ZinT family metal-binding protein n=1 Tax=Halomonas sp. ND22Bw TaxID=2054178 RepID=UPI000D0BCFA7|nr:metal-binding protein ZinT [Halomonas sp. ND22Bw]